MEKNSQPQAINAGKLLRHWLGAMKFRFTVSISGTASDFASFDAGYGVSTPIEIVCHISQLLQNCCSTIAGSPRVRLESKGWYEEAARFYEIVEQLDQAILQFIQQNGLKRSMRGRSERLKWINEADAGGCCTWGSYASVLNVS